MVPFRATFWHLCCDRLGTIYPQLPFAFGRTGLEVCGILLYHKAQLLSPQKEPLKALPARLSTQHTDNESYHPVSLQTAPHIQPSLLHTTCSAS